MGSPTYHLAVTMLRGDLAVPADVIAQLLKEGIDYAALEAATSPISRGGQHGQE